MQLEVWGQTDVGLKRESNQDSFLIDADLGLFVVADGMGGHRGGEVASALAVQTLKEVVAEALATEAEINPRILMVRAYREASRRIFHVSKVKEELRGMGTTMVAVLFRNDTLYIGNVGDSRAYLINAECCWQATEDHSLLYEHLRAGLLKDEDIPKFFSKNIITRSVGYEGDVVCDVIERKIQPGEMVLLCSDGLSGMVDDKTIVQIIRTAPVEMVVPALIDEAKRKGGDDNVTALLLRATSGDNKK